MHFRGSICLRREAWLEQRNASNFYIACYRFCPES
jgi:hypothetical protein